MATRGRKPGSGMSRKQFLETTVARFWDKVTRKGPDECWPWIGQLQHFAKNGIRYGQFAVSLGNRKQYSYRAHRVAYLLAKGRIPPGFVIRHTCDNAVCCNPAHLLAGTQTQNVQDQVDRGRVSKGERNRHAKLTAEQVMEIRASDESDGVLSARYGVKRWAIGDIRSGRKWKHLPGARPGFYDQRKSRKLTSEQRETIRQRRRSGESLKSLAAEFGVAPGYVCVLAGRVSRVGRKGIFSTGDPNG